MSDDDEVNEWIKKLRTERDTARIEVARLRDELRARRDAAAIEHKIIDDERVLADDPYDKLNALIVAWQVNVADQPGSPPPTVVIEGRQVLARYREARSRD